MANRGLFNASYRVLLYDELEEYESAIERLSEHLKINPRAGVAYNNRGLAYWEIGELEKALSDFALAMQCSPTDPIPYVNRGQLYQRLLPPRTREAVADLTHAIALRGDDATLHRCKAYACLDCNLIQDAIASFSAAIQLEPEFRQTYIDRGKAYEKLGLHENAERDRAIAAKLPA